MSGESLSNRKSAAVGPRCGQARDVCTSIILPAYNEVQNVGPLTDELLNVIADEAMEQFSPVEIIAVDDGSTDGTRREIRDLATVIPQVTAISLRRNFGQSAALAAGFEYASGMYVVTMDADRQNNPADVPVLLSRLTEGYDCVSGWRKDRQDPLSKRLPSAIQTRLAKLTGPDIHDFGCTLKAYRRDALEDLDLYGEGHRYIPAKLHKQGYEITEIPVDHRPRTAGETKYGAKRLVKGLVDLVFHIFWNRYSTRPIHFLDGVGLLLLGLGGVIGVHAVISKYVFGEELVPHLPRLILTVALILFGLQLIMFGFRAEMITKLHYGSGREYSIAAVYGDDE